MKIGRNEMCPCGSGKKYKNCCMNSVESVQALWNLGIDAIASENKMDLRMAKVFVAMLDFLRQAKWLGACHGISAILYVIYNELGFNPKLCTGIIGRDYWMTVHSWIEIDDKVFDAACYFPEEGCPKVMPVFNGIELGTMGPSSTLYGLAISDSPAKDIQKMTDIGTTVPKVLNGEYEKIEGASLWNVLDNVCLLSGIGNVLAVSGDYLDTTRLAEKYKYARWTLRNHIAVSEKQILR